LKNCTFLFVFLIYFKSPHSENCAGKRIKIIKIEYSRRIPHAERGPFCL